MEFTVLFLIFAVVGYLIALGALSHRPVPDVQ